MAVLGYLTNSKRSLRLAFGAYFLHDFSMKMLLIYRWRKFHCHTFFPSQDIKQNVLLRFYLYGCLRHKL